MREGGPYTVEIVQQSRGRALVRDKVVAKFENVTGPFRWDGRVKRRAVPDGYYYARFTVPIEDGAEDVRRVALRRSHGRFSAVPNFAQKTSCGIFTKYELSSSVFGGARNAPLRITYLLAHDVDGVVVTVRHGKDVVQRFGASGSSTEEHTLTLPAASVPRGATVTVRAAVKNGPGGGEKLSAKRL